MAPVPQWFPELSLGTCGFRFWTGVFTWSVVGGFYLNLNLREMGCRLWRVTVKFGLIEIRAGGQPIFVTGCLAVIRESVPSAHSPRVLMGLSFPSTKSIKTYILKRRDTGRSAIRHVHVP